MARGNGNGYGSFVYVYRTGDGRHVKIGSGDPIARFNSHSAAAPDLEWVVAVPGGKTQEDFVRGHWSPRYHVDREVFLYEGKLKAWVDRVRGMPGVALSADDLGGAYPVPGWLPGADSPLPPVDTQQALAFGIKPDRKRKPRDKKLPHNIGTLSSESDDWYTPPLYVEAARKIMGGIDLDPASCAEANRIVRADAIYTAKEDGLQREWHGRVWLNPPFGGAQRAFVAHLLAEYERGNVTAAVLLVNSNTTDTEWFQPLWNAALCFTNHRIPFKAPAGAGDGERSGTVGSIFAYLGPNPDAFVSEFGWFGATGRMTPPYATRQEFRRKYPDLWTPEAA